MFSRRQNRSVHDTSYTGVNPAASRDSQPNSNALAAALSIGKSFKQQGHQEGYTSNSGSDNYLAKPPQKRNSLLKRNSITRSPGNKFRNFSDASYNSANSIQTPPHSSQRRSSIQGSARGNHSVDNSFDDSYYDEAHQDIQNYNNANMRDLRLSHQMSPPPSGNGNSGQDSVRMVKKYIPTPNGIKVIEVPETVYKKEMARNNSLRSMPRSSSMTSLSQRKLPRTTSLNSVSGGNKRPHQRLSSLSRGSNLRTMTEKDETQYNKRDNDSELEKLQQQIDHEKQVSRDLELKRLEYEKIKLDRLENEKKLLLLQKEETKKNADEGIIEEDEEEEDEPVPNILLIVDEVENKHLSADKKDSTIEKPSLGQINDVSRDEDLNASIDDASIYESEAIPDASIDASSVVVDELEKKNIDGDDGHPSGYKNDQGAAELNVINQYTESKELLNRDSIIDHPISASADEEDEFGIEEVPYDDLNEGNLAKQLRPKFDSHPGDNDDSRPAFDPNPEIINDNEAEEIEKPIKDGLEPDLDLNIQTLRIPIPPINNGSSSSSVHSTGSFDSNILSREEKRPVKSAMKNSSSFYNSSNNSSVVKNAAQDAYLSLATAENTRLNSKLSSSQLNDKQVQSNGNASQAQHFNYTSAYPENQSAQPKRTTLRKSPSVQSTGLASRSLRPQSALPETLPHNSYQNSQNSNIGMGNRKLRDRSSVQVSPSRDRTSYVSPISAHPALQPNYQSPSKVRAAELYAKANARPKSSFSPIPKKENSNNMANKQLKNQPHRTTLRDISSPGQGQRIDKAENNEIHNKEETNSSPLEHRKGFKSRLADSDEENENEGRSKFFSGGFASRFNDSDEDVAGISKSHKVVNGGTSHETSMRNESSSGLMANGNKSSPEDRNKTSSKPKHKEKRKFAKLRKLFGKD